MSSLLQATTLSVLERASHTPAARFDAPAADEHDPYYSKYTSLVPPGDFFALLRAQAADVSACFGSLTPAQAAFAYAPGKWTVTDVLGHMIDTERVFTYRATTIGRGDTSAMPGYDQDEWAARAGYASRPIGSVLAEWLVVRAATLVLAEGFPADAPTRRGTASERPFTARALLHVVAGHTIYHLQHTRRLYLQAEGWPA